MINKLLLGKPVETLCHASCYFVQSYRSRPVHPFSLPSKDKQCYFIMCLTEHNQPNTRKQDVNYLLLLWNDNGLEKEVFCWWNIFSISVFTLTNPTALSLLGQISVILAKGESECCMLLFDIKTTFRDKTMSDKNDNIFGGD